MTIVNTKEDLLALEGTERTEALQLLQGTTRRQVRTNEGAGDDAEPTFGEVTNYEAVERLGLTGEEFEALLSQG